VPAPQYDRPAFGSISTKRLSRRRLWIGLACLTVVMIGAFVMIPPGARVSDAAVAPVDNSSSETIPATRLGDSAIDPQVTIVNGAEAGLDKPYCVIGQHSDGNCVAFQLPKVRMVRVPRTASIGQQGNLAKSGLAASRSPSLDNAEPEKAQRSAHRRYQRGTQSRREARRGDWTARGYASRHRRHEGRESFARGFW